MVVLTKMIVFRGAVLAEGARVIDDVRQYAQQRIEGRWQASLKFF